MKGQSASEAVSPEFQEHSEKRSVVTSALVFAMGTLSSRILGLIRDAMTARYFSNDVRDAFVCAFRLPNFFRRLLGEGALSISFVPVFIEILTMRAPDEVSASERELKTRQLISGVFSILLSLTLTLSCLALIFMEEIMGFLLQGEAFQRVPGKMELTVRLGRIMFGFLILISLYAFFMAILHGFRRFALSAFAPCFFNVAMISAALISPRFAAPVELLAWAVLFGGFVQMAILIPSVVRLGYWPRFTWSWSSPELLRVLKATLPGLIGMSVMQVTTIVNLYFSSYLPSGSQSYIYLADRILELPLSLFVVSIGSALLPTLAKYWTEGNREAMGDTINHYIRLILFVTLPAAIGLFFLSQPIVEVLFLGREFKYADALATAGVVRVYAFTVILAAGVRILAQGFYAIHNTWFPALAAGVALAAHVLFAYSLTHKFGLYGLVSASVLSTAVNLMMLAAAYNSWVGPLHLRSMLKSLGKFLVGAVLMIGVLLMYEPLLHSFGSRYVTKTFVLFAIIISAGFVYMLSAHLLRVVEYHETAATIMAKIRKRAAPSRHRTSRPIE